MKKVFIILLFLGALPQARSQVAMDFNMDDCNGNMHNLYLDYLDNDQVVIIEYFMTCSSCIEVGQKLTPMYNQLAIDYPGMVNFFAFNFLDDLSCTVAEDFVNNWGINAIPFDSGAAQLAYYGGFGMPSVVIVGGSQHEIIYFSKTVAGVNDTAAMDNAIRDFFTTLGNEDVEEVSYSMYPNPASETVYLQFEDNKYLNTEIILCNSAGQPLLCQKLIEPNQMIDIHGLPAGLYFIRVNGENIHSAKKLIICK